MPSSPPLPRSALLAATGLAALAGLGEYAALCVTAALPVLPLRPRLLLFAAVPWAIWVALLPALRHAVSRWPLAPALRGRSLLVHAALAVATSGVVVGVALALGGLLGWTSRRPLGEWLNRIDAHLVLYAALAALMAARETAWTNLAEEARAAALDEDVARAQSAVLALQLHPHFLFNTLNSVAELAHRDPPDAVRMLRDLRSLLVQSFDRSARNEVTLGEELGFVRAYAEIQQRRFRGLEVRIEAGADVLEARVPHLLLQPVVENALRHGVAPTGGRVVVRAWREDAQLRIDVDDDGGASGPSPGHGLGLRHTRERLAMLGGGRHRLDLERRAAGGTRVQLALPFVGA